MLKENLVMLRNIRGFSQEEIAGRIGISRQAYAKWESGATVPDIEKCKALADEYGTTVDALITPASTENGGTLPPAPVGKHIWGFVTVNECGQIVIPKSAREELGIPGGQRLIVLSDETGIALVKAETFENNIRSILKCAGQKAD